MPSHKLQATGLRVGDLVEIAEAPAVVSLGWLEGVRGKLRAGAGASAEVGSLLSGYSLQDPETRAAFEAITRSLGRSEERGDAFLISGVYGAGKSHLLAALALLAGHPQESWPHFLTSHAGYDRIAAACGRPRLVVAIALDEHSATHSLEHIVLSRLEEELARGHRVRVALTEESHLLDLVERYVVPQVGEQLDAAAREAAGQRRDCHGAAYAAAPRNDSTGALRQQATKATETWRDLREGDAARAAEVALAFIEETGFPLDWRRSRAEAWGALRRALETNGIDGPLILLDELGLFLAGKDRRGLNADASFLQYVAQRASGERCWLVGVTQRGLEEVGDIDRRTLRQLRDRFRPSFTLSLADLGWVVRHRLAPRREGFETGVREVWARLPSGDLFSPEELARSYPLNPLCLEALRRAAEAALSQTRSAVRLLQETAREAQWPARPAERLITSEVVFDCFQGEMEMSAVGRKLGHAYEVVMANVERILPGREAEIAAVMKTLCLLGLGEIRWPVKQVRASLVGSESAWWQRGEGLREVLGALYRYGLYVERARGEGEDDDAYYVDVSTDASERIRQRLNELVAEMTPGDSRVERAALEACREEGFPLAGLLETRSLGVEWWHARRFVNAACRDLSEITAGELRNLAGALAAPGCREDGWLFVASPWANSEEQARVWRDAASGVEDRFAVGLVAWAPRSLSEGEREQLVEHAALTRMVSDPTVARSRDREIRGRVRARWEESEARVRGMVRRAYYEGRVIGGGEEIGAERLTPLEGRWEETLTAVFDGAFRRLFPRFSEIAPERRLAGRAQTNQIIDQFIRPGEVSLPPASTLEANLVAYAAPLGLMEGGDRHFRLALARRELVSAAVEAAPARAGGEEVEPEEVARYDEWAGRLGKSEWGVTREQCELLVAALVKTGYLVGLDAFLQPVRLEAIAAPLGENLPYVMRGEALEGRAGEAARELWAAATGGSRGNWDLPTQERAWSEMMEWAAGMMAEGHRAALGRAAEALGQTREEWAWAEEALTRGEMLARRVDGTLTSWQGLARLAAAAEAMSGGVGECSRAVETWRRCERFLGDGFASIAQLRRMIGDERVRCAEGSLLAREREVALAAFRSPARLVEQASEVRSQATRWLEAYGRHYLAWHSAMYAAGRFAELARLKQSTTLEAARRLARAGMRNEDGERAEAEIAAGLARRCSAAEALPTGAVVCPSCGLRLGDEVTLPEVAELARIAEAALAGQMGELAEQAELLRRRLAGCGDERLAAAVERLLAAGSAEEVAGALNEEVVAWVRAQLGQPRAKRRELADLAGALRGKEMPRREVVRRVEEWLGGGEDEVVEVV